MEKEKRPTCPYCLADSRFTAIAEDKLRRCPLCGSDYTGEKREAEYTALLEAGLVAEDD